MKHLNRTGTGHNDTTLSKPNPLLAILGQELSPVGPVISFILLPVGVNPLDNLGRQTIDQAFHRTPQSDLS
jgi:hypothetical protein